MRRVRFKKSGNVLRARAKDGRTTFIHSLPGRQDATADAIRRIAAGDYTLAPLLAVADIKRVRPPLLIAARAVSILEPNLSQALALIGGVEERRILRLHLKKSLDAGFKGRRVEEQFCILYNAAALLRLSPSILAARVLEDAVSSGSAQTTQTAAKLVSDYLLTNPPLRIERLLLARLPLILTSNDASFVGAVPILLRRHHGPTMDRCSRLIEHGNDETRRVLILNLLGCPYYGLPLLLRAFAVERQLDVRLRIARELAPALPSTDLSKLAREALDDQSAATRLAGAQLLAAIPPHEAQQLARRKDPEDLVESILRKYRSARPVLG